MEKIIHLISDLHLTESEPHLFALFEHYMQNIAPQSQKLFILGDLFEVWVGDDFQTPFNQKAIDLLHRYSQKHGELLIAHGNRDFLIGERFATQTGATLIEGVQCFQWQDIDICVMHGDSLCTDDSDYQQFRTMVRSPKWQQEFLCLPIEKRREIAGGIRQKSQDEQKSKTMAIMDVNLTAVEKSFEQHQNQWLIHGHTHREGSHRIPLPSRKQGWRIVLSDWGQNGHYLELKDKGFNSHYFSLP